VKALEKIVDRSEGGFDGAMAMSEARKLSASELTGPYDRSRMDLLQGWRTRLVRRFDIYHSLEFSIRLNTISPRINAFRSTWSSKRTVSHLLEHVPKRLLVLIEKTKLVCINVWRGMQHRRDRSDPFDNVDDRSEQV
jgi:hypothetical protein